MCFRCAGAGSVAVCMVGTLTYFAKPGSSLFSWHPFCMTLAYSGLAATAVMMLCPARPSLLQKRSQRITAHWVCCALAGASMLVGFAAIYQNKELHNKEHFVSLHSQFGRVANVLLLSQLTFGVFMKYPHWLKSVVSASTLRLGHITSGSLVLSVATVTFILGVTSGWGKQVLGTNVTGALIAGQVGLLLCLGYQVWGKRGGKSKAK